jgi:hypothetical protein
VEEDKGQGSETLHFPFVIENFRTIGIQSILKFCISIILREEARDFSPLADCTKEYLFRQN